MLFFLLVLGLQPELDTITFRDSKTVQAVALEVTPELVKYQLPGDRVINSAAKVTIAKIEYANGKVTEFEGLPVIRGKHDWKKVIITRNPDDVKGLKRVAEIKGRSGHGGLSAGLGVRNAENALKKKAAKLKCPVVLVDRTSKAFGVMIKGVAYK